MEKEQIVKIKEIKGCGECPHCGTDEDVDIACKLKNKKHFGRKIPKGTLIPSWCPLPDKLGYTNQPSQVSAEALRRKTYKPLQDKGKGE